MKRLVVLLAVILVSVGASAAVPYPYGDYEVSTTGDLQAIYEQVENTYRVPIQAEGDSVYPWSDLSFVVLEAPAVLDARINRDADFGFWTDTEKEEKREQYFSMFIENEINFGLLLAADPDVSYGFRYVEPEGSSSYISRIILETSDGGRYTPIYTSDSSADLIASMWVAVNSVSFPRYDQGEQIISDSTEWIRLWIIAGTDRAYFHFDFEH